MAAEIENLRTMHMAKSLYEAYLEWVKAGRPKCVPRKPEKGEPCKRHP